MKMAEEMTRSIKRIAVITGDPSLPDPTKREGCYHEEDAQSHQLMMDAFNGLEAFKPEFWSEHASSLSPA